MKLDEPVDQLVTNETNEGPSQIRDFYENSSVFITGGFGFLGRLAMEKILRSCPGVSRVYLLGRPKKGKTSEERLDALFNDIVFEKLLLQDPKCRSKVTLVNGDLEHENLGLSEADEKMLINEVNIVLHIAATVRFDEQLRKAVYINLRAVRDMLLMAKKMQKLKSFVHVSTAYAHCINKEVDEVFYEMPITGENLLNLISLVDDDYLNTLTPSLIGKWPNTYTFTKALAELQVKELGKELPVSIVRPSIVILTLKEPLVGWANNYYGALGISYAVALGLLHTLYCDPDYLADIVPADFTVNSIIAASWAVGQSPSEKSQGQISNVSFDELSVRGDVPIFNYVCSPEYPMSWGKYVQVTSSVALKYPSVNYIWYLSIFLNKHLLLHKICHFFLHWVPAHIADVVLYLIGRKPIAVDGFKKAEKLILALEYFMMREWIFKNNNVQTLWKKLSKADQAVFKFSMANVDYGTTLPEITKAARVHVFKDTWDTLPQARKKLLKLKIAHFTVVYLFYFGLAYFFWKIMSLFFF